MTRVTLFAAGLAGVFLAALALGSAFDVSERTVVEAHAADDSHAVAPALPGGLSLEQDGYRLVGDRKTLVPGRPEPYVFRILDPSGHVLRDYDVEHTKRLHLIVVDRGLDRFIHIHPRQRPDGAWTVPLTLPENGSYRVFADFTTGGERRTLGLDLLGRGGKDVVLERPARYDVTLHGHGSELDFTVRRAGKPVQLQRYLGARGHLVVLREGDLAYIHAHADEERLSFAVPFPSAGRYRLFLQFKVGGTVETASLEAQR